MFEANLICHPWDLVDEGVEDVLDRVQGELGATGVNIPVFCPPIQILRCRSRNIPRLFSFGGGGLFAPDEAYYEATRCKPAASSWLKNRDPLSSTAQQCRDRGLKCRAVVDLTQVAPLLVKHPEAAAKNALGDSWPDRLCLVNPDVQAMVVGLCRDLADNYALTGIELRGLIQGASVEGGWDLPAEPGPAGRLVLGTCFCESCRQLDAVDTDSAVESAQKLLGELLTSGRPIDGRPQELAAEYPEFQAYTEAQQRSYGRLVKTITERCELPITLHLEPDLIEPDDRIELPAALIGAAQALVSRATPPVAASYERTAGSLFELAAKAQAVELEIRPISPHEPDSPPQDALVRCLSRLVELGVGGVNLDNYGQLPEQARANAYTAIRFARRQGREV